MLRWMNECPNHQPTVFGGIVCFWLFRQFLAKCCSHCHPFTCERCTLHREREKKKLCVNQRRIWLGFVTLSMRSSMGSTNCWTFPFRNCNIFHSSKVAYHIHGFQRQPFFGQQKMWLTEFRLRYPSDMTPMGRRLLNIERGNEFLASRFCGFERMKYPETTWNPGDGMYAMHTILSRDTTPNCRSLKFQFHIELSTNVVCVRAMSQSQQQAIDACYFVIILSTLMAWCRWCAVARSMKQYYFRLSAKATHMDAVSLLRASRNDEISCFERMFCSVCVNAIGSSMRSGTVRRIQHWNTENDDKFSRQRKTF